MKKRKPKQNLSLLEKNFSLYSDKTESDYWVMVNGQRIPTNLAIITEDEKELVKNLDGVAIYENEFIEKLSPDNIDSREFWKIATDKFPLFSIAGGVQTITTIDQVNEQTLAMAALLGVLKPLDLLYQENPNLRLLEIGPGHGGLQKALKKFYGDDNYYAIDVNLLFEHPRFYQTDGKTIPDTIPYPMDIVYSVNVFQHLSKAQRTSYYKQILEVLRFGGVFIFGMFVVTEKNKNWPCWGIKGQNGKYYCNFFKQLTEIEREEVIIKELNEIGFEVIPLSEYSDTSHYLTYQCTKIVPSF